MKSDKLKLRRHSDGMYIFAIIFAAIGGLALLGSYADRNNQATSQPGTYKLSDFTDGSDTYSLSLKSGLLYCFPGLNAAGQTVTVTPPGGPVSRLPLQVGGPQDSCFVATTSYPKAIVNLPVEDNTGNLVVRQQ